MRTSVQSTLLAVAVLVGAACPGPDAIDEGAVTDTNTGVARGANVQPLPADTLARGTATYNTATAAATWVVNTPPVGTLDSVVLYQVGAATAALPASATAVLCSTAAACATGSGTATGPGPTFAALTDAQKSAIKTSIRAYGTQLVFFADTAGTAPPVQRMRGTMYPDPAE